MKQVLDAAVLGAKGAVFLTFIVNLLVGISLNSLWSVINAQQLMILLPIFDVVLPATAVPFFKEAFGIASFDVYEGLSDATDSMLGLEPSEPMKENFAEIGFESTYFLNNLGS